MLGAVGFQTLRSSSEDGISVTSTFDDLPSIAKKVVQTLIRAAEVRIELLISHGHVFTRRLLVRPAVA